MSNKKKFTVIGVNEVEHERIQMALQLKFHNPMSKFEFEEKALPKDEAFLNDVETYFKEQLEMVLREEQPNVYKALQSSVQFYGKDYKDYVNNRKENMEQNKRFYEKTKNFLEYISQFIFYDEKTNVITYERNEAIDTFLMLIDILDLDEKLKDEVELKKHQKQAQTTQDEKSE